jgi:hypothetical protein
MSNADHLHPHRTAAYERVREALRRWDPIGVICESNQDEYDSHAQDFAARLDARMPVDEIVESMRQLVLGNMGMSSFNEARARACATDLAEFWRAHRTARASAAERLD